ncbi:hypothetical protein [Peribacillus deserti]|nr:hypothetical protein [Peribacillus deserti]
MSDAIKHAGLPLTYYGQGLFVFRAKKIMAGITAESISKKYGK